VLGNGYFCTTSHPGYYASVTGGTANQASAENSTISGGDGNLAGGAFASSVSGGKKTKPRAKSLHQRRWRRRLGDQPIQLGVDVDRFGGIHHKDERLGPDAVVPCSHLPLPRQSSHHHPYARSDALSSSISTTPATWSMSAS
jgi:hypothetical protein